jgi:hypothetical protein
MKNRVHSVKKKTSKIFGSECSQILFARPLGKVLGSEIGRKIKSGLFYDYATEERG